MSLFELDQQFVWYYYGIAKSLPTSPWLRAVYNLRHSLLYIKPNSNFDFQYQGCGTS